MTSDRRAIFLKEMGIGPLWQRREALNAAEVRQPAEESPVVAAVLEDAPPFPAFDNDPVGLQPEISREIAILAEKAPAAPEVATMDWAQLKASVADCTKCGLCQGRTKTVFGVGDEKAKWLFVGEGPGFNEDRIGEPFVGKAGQLLDNMLLAMGLKRGENAYIANIVKCRPTDDAGRDRPPTAEERAACMPYLERQIALIQPTILVALGKTAALALLALDPETPVSTLRGTVHRYAERPLIVTYHPAYLLRNMADKKKAWADLCLAMSTYAGVN